MLAVKRLTDKRSSLLWAPEAAIVTQAEEVELDICVILDGRIIVGEAKSNNSLKAKNGTQEAAARLVRAAQVLTADEIVLATSEAAWAKGTLDIVKAAIESNWRRGPRPTEVPFVMSSWWSADESGAGQAAVEHVGAVLELA